MQTVSLISWPSDIDPPKALPPSWHEDPIALACAVHRQWCKDPTSNSNRWQDLAQASAEDQDRDMAVQIRQYYSNRIMLDLLRGTGTVSEFRKKLYGFVAQDRMLTANEIGLLYKLPYFYAEDTALDHVVSVIESCDAPKSMAQQVTAKFWPLHKILRSRKSGDMVQYWMRSDHGAGAYMLSIKLNDPYHKLIDGLMQQPVVLSTWLHAKSFMGYHRDRWYYAMNSIELVQ